MCLLITSGFQSGLIIDTTSIADTASSKTENLRSKLSKLVQKYPLKANSVLEALITVAGDFKIPMGVSMSIFFDGGIGSKIDGFVQGANGSRFRSQCDT